MVLRQACSSDVTATPFLRGFCDTSSCSKLSSCPVVSSIFTTAPKHTLPPDSTPHRSIFSSHLSELQRSHNRKAQPCPAVAAPDAPPRTVQNPRLHQRVARERVQQPRDGLTDGLTDGLAERLAVFEEVVPRGRDSGTYESEGQDVWWPAVEASKGEEMGEGTARGVAVAVGKRGRLQKLLEQEAMSEREGKGVLAHGVGSVRGGEGKGLGRDSGKDREQRLKGGPFREVLRKAGGGRGVGKQQSSQMQCSRSKTFIKGWGTMRKGPLMGIEGKQDEGVDKARLPDAMNPGDGASIEQDVVDLALEEDIASALDRDLAALISPPESETDGRELEAAGTGAAEQEALRGRDFVTPRRPLQASPIAQMHRSQSKLSPLVAAPGAEKGSLYKRKDSPHTSWLRLGTESRTAREEGGEPQASDTLLKDAKTVFDPLLDLLEDASSGEAVNSISPGQRKFKTQHRLRVRQQQALLASVEDETWLQRPWEVEQTRPETGPPIGLERLGNDSGTSGKVRDRSFQPKHDKKGKPWERSKLRRFYERRYANRYGDKETAPEEVPRVVTGLDAQIGEGKPGEKPPPAKNRFLFPPLPRPLPHEITTRRRVEKVPGAKFRSVPPKQRETLPLREAAAVSRGLGGGLVGNPGETMGVTSEMREEARGAVLRKVLAAEKGGVPKVLDRIASTLHSTDVTFLLNALSTRGATNRALEVLSWAEKAPRSMYRLPPQPAAYVVVARGFLLEGNVTGGVDFALSASARGKQLGSEVWGRLLVGLAQQGEYGRVSEVLDRLKMTGEVLDGRFWRGLITAHVRGSNRSESMGLVGRLREGMVKGEITLPRLDYEEIVAACGGAGLLDKTSELIEDMETARSEVRGRLISA